MKRLTHELVQGTEPWLAFRAVHFGASEAGAMLGLSPKTTRDELLRLKYLGLGKDFSSYVQEKVLDEGHRLEALALPMAEEIVGSDLYAATMSMGKLSASCDGLTFDDETAFEHKSYNEPMAELMRQGIVPPEHMPQCQQVLLVTGAKRLLFMLSDGTPDRLLHVWVYPDTVMFDQLQRGWAQFEQDLAAYVLPSAAAPAAVGRAPDTLPSVVVEIRGEVVSSNLLAIKGQAVAVFANINRDLQTDQDFADAATTVKWCEDIEARLKAAKAHALGQAKSIDEVFSAIDEIISSSSTARIALSKLVTRRNEERKGEIVATGVTALREHMHQLNERLGRNLMPVVAADFAGAVKNKRSFTSMTAAVNAEVSRVQIEASAIADRIQANVKSLVVDTNDWEFLFPDLASVCQKPAEDFANLLSARIHKHQQIQEALKAAEAAAKAIEDARITAEFAAEQRARDAANEAAAAPAPAPAPLPPVPRAPEPQAQHALQAPLLNLNTPFEETERPTLKLGDISARLGFTVNADFLSELGFTATVERNARLYRESLFPAICDAIRAHITGVREQHAYQPRASASV